jgi:dTDP-4-dehydrorhamnose reductase
MTTRPPKILLLGKDGQLGWELQRPLSTIGPLVACDRQTVNLENLEELRSQIRHHQPAFIVNAAAYTAVDKAETEQAKAYQINETAVRVMAEEAYRLGAWLVHYSTDYVFDGEKTSAYTEEDAPHPLNVYGHSKLAGEVAISSVDCKHLIIRSGWLYSAHGSGFPLAILRRAIERDQIEVVADSFGAPTSAHLVADVTAAILHQINDPQQSEKLSGTYHLTASGETSWYDFAQFLLGLARNRGLPIKATSNRVFPTTRASYGAVAARPENSRLETSLLRDRFRVHLPDWKIHANRFIEEVARSRLL